MHGRCSMVTALGRLLGRVARSIGWRHMVAMLACGCAIAWHAGFRMESRRVSPPPGSELPATLRPAVLQALNQEAGPEFDIVSPLTKWPQGEGSRAHFRAVNNA